MKKINLAPRFFPSFLKKIAAQYNSSGYKYATHKRPENKKIIFLCPSIPNMAGGIKVIYRQAALIDTLAAFPYSAEILHPDNTDHKYDWFDANTKFKKNLSFNQASDFVVIPEVMAIPHAALLHAEGIRYAIYVQNAYSLKFAAFLGSQSELELAYKNATCILSISDDSTECLKIIFPFLKERIVRIYYSLAHDRFKSAKSKENLITFMPRKLKGHSELVLFFMKHVLPSNWHFQPIDGLNEDGVVELLGRSKIFLSFSEFEGCPLPPVEAALAGNYVIGYTGEGAKEYWRAPLFNEIQCGDIRGFCREILSTIHALDHETLPASIDSSYLADKYSADNEIASLKLFLSHVAGAEA
jgi:hypothetical protein